MDKSKVPRFYGPHCIGPMQRYPNSINWKLTHWLLVAQGMFTLILISIIAVPLCPFILQR